MPSEWWENDDQLLATLADAMTAERRVPREFVEAGKAVYQHRDLDAELAQLIYDSERELAFTRAETATLRALTFATNTVTIELEVGPDGLLGQIVPPGPTGIDVQDAGQAVIHLDSDELGCFVVRPRPSGPFRLRCFRESALDVVTSWVTI